MKGFRRQLKALADDLQTDLVAAVETHLDVVRGTLDIIRSENVASESERDPAFRGRVQMEVGAAKDNMQRILEVVDALNGTRR